MKILKAIFVTMLVLLLANSPALADCLGQGTVSIVVKDHDTTVFNINDVPWIEGETARLAMLNAINKEPSFTYESKYLCPYGDYITEIVNIQPKQNEYWALSINGQFIEAGIDTTILQKDAILLWEIKEKLLPPRQLNDSNL